MLSENYSEKSRTITFVLCFFFGSMGVHRFYIGKIGTGILQFITLGGFGVWLLIDLIRILAGVFEDRYGLKIKNW